MGNEKMEPRMDTKEREEAARQELRLESETQRVREARRTVRSATVFRELKMCPETLGRLRVNSGLKFRKEGSRYFYNLEEVARAYLTTAKWKLNRVKDACERYLKKCEDNREYFRQWRARKAQAERAEAEAESAATENGKMEPRMDTKEREEAARQEQRMRRRIELLDELIARTERAALKGESGGATAESTATQLALQDAAEAEARTREERDKLREEVERLSRANAELAAKNVELREEAEWWRREAKKQEGYADALAKKNAWLTAKVAVADWRGGSGGNAEASL